MKKFKTTVWNYAVLGALVAFVWGKSAQTILLAVVAFLLYLLVRSNLSRSLSLSNSTPSPDDADDNHLAVSDEEFGVTDKGSESPLYHANEQQ